MKVGEIASQLGGELDGDPDVEIHGIADVASVVSNQIAFYTSNSFEQPLDIPSDACVLITRDLAGDFPFITIRVDDPKMAFARIAATWHSPFHDKNGRDENVVIGAGADVRARFIGSNVSIGKNSQIGEDTVLCDGVRIGENVIIGKRSILHPNIVVYDNCEIGNECILHAGAVIGAEGFGYVRDGDEIIKFPQIGRVVIGDKVEIGANTCIDRGALGETRIGNNTKIDNLVQVAHNVSIGERVLIAGLVGISGSVVIEDDVVIGGQVGISDHVTIKKGAIIGARSAVFPGKIVRAGVWVGTPVQPIRKYKEQNALIRSLSRLKTEIDEIKKKLN